MKKWWILAFMLGYISYSQAQTPFECNGQYYLSIALGSSGESIIYEVVINPFNGNAEFVTLGNQGANQNLNALGYRSTDNFLYAINPFSHSLYRIGTEGIANFVSNLNLQSGFGYWGGAITPDGSTMIFIASTNDASKNLVFIDLDTFDVLQTIPLKDNSTGNATTALCTDIAFNPLTGELFGMDANADRLLRFDINTGIVFDDLFPTNNVADRMGAVFFDSFGFMYGYDKPTGGAIANTLFKINTVTGEFEAIAQGPTATGKDGCSCPYTVQLQKTVSPEITLPCSEVVYTFSIANASGYVQMGVTLEDKMPEGFTITEILEHPFGGEILEGIGGNHLWINDLTLPVGIHTLSIRVELGSDLTGIYQNQATLFDLPPTLGEMTFSDNPQTVILNDSTSLLITALEVDFGMDTTAICLGENLTLDATQLIDVPINYEWNIGDTTSFITIQEGGQYAVTVSNACETYTNSIIVLENEISVELGADLTIELGDSVPLSPVISSATPYLFEWFDPQENTLNCPTCFEPFAMPLFESTYYFTAFDQGGCEAVDSITIEVITNYQVYIPNAFSPNFDGINDTFFPQTPNEQRLQYFAIFDRWGNQVFESKNTLTNTPSYGWDGTFRGKDMNPAVFAYVAEVLFLDGHVEQLSGDVTLLR